MNKKTHKWIVVLLVAAVGVFHVVMFLLHPHRPPYPKTEVVWGDLSDKQPDALQSTSFAPSFCSDLPQVDKQEATDFIDMAVNRIRFEYRPEADDFINKGGLAEIMMGQSGTITLGNKTYPLQKIVFARTGASGQMALYLIHHVNSGGGVVVSVPLQIAEKGNSIIDTLWHYLPQLPGEHNSLDDIHVDINNLLPHDRTYYRYTSNGDCSNNVIMLGLVSPVLISSTQADTLSQALAEHDASKMK